VTTLLASTTALPTFPNDWDADEISNLVQLQGAVKTGDAACCPAGMNCKLQVQAQSGHHWFDFSNNRTRFGTGGENDIVNYYYPVYKQVKVDANNSCEFYCPINFDLEPLSLDSNATDIGTAVVGGKTVEAYQWFDKEPIFGVMQVNTFYVDQSGKTPLPVLEYDKLTPFGQYLGDSNNSYANFRAGKQDPSKFRVNGVEDCPLDPQGCGQSSLMSRMRAAKPVSPLLSALRAAAEEPASEAILAPSADFLAGKIPVLPTDYTTDERDSVIIAQGPVQTIGGDQCCGFTDNCQVQQEFEFGKAYVDYTNQRTRFGDIVSLYGNVNKQMQVDANNTCQQYCPLDDGLMPLSLPNTTIDMGSVEIDGKTYQHYQYKDTILGVVTMDVVDMYVDMSDPSKPVPYLQHMLLTPFGGPPLGNSNVTWTNWNTGEPEPSVFDVNGIDSCKEASGCNDNAVFRRARLLNKSPMSLLRNFVGKF